MSHCQSRSSQCRVADYEDQALEKLEQSGREGECSDSVFADCEEKKDVASAYSPTTRIKKEKE